MAYQLPSWTLVVASGQRQLAVAVWMVLVTESVTVITISAFMIGFFLLCCVALSSMQTAKLSGRARYPHDWGLLTLGFGLSLAIGSYGMSSLLSLGMHYYSLFVIAQGILGATLLLSLWLLYRNRPLACVDT